MGKNGCNVFNKLLLPFKILSAILLLSIFLNIIRNFKRQMLKQPGLISSVLHLSVFCNCHTYYDNIGPKLKKLRFAILGVQNIFEIKVPPIFLNISMPSIGSIYRPRYIGPRI